MKGNILENEKKSGFLSHSRILYQIDERPVRNRVNVGFSQFNYNENQDYTFHKKIKQISNT